MNIINALSTDSLFDHAGIIPRVFDIVIKGDRNIMRAVGIAHVIRKLEKTGDIRIFRYSAYYTSSLLAVVLCSGVSLDKIQSFFQHYERDHWQQELLSILPDDAYRRCNHRVFIHVSSSKWGKHHHICEFNSNSDIVNACTSALHSNNMWQDVIYFKDGKHVQMIIDITDKPNNPDDVQKGMKEAELFFLRKECNSLQWYHYPENRQRRSIFFFTMLPLLLLFFLTNKKT